MAKILLIQLAIKSLFKFSFYPTSASASGESKPSTIHVEMNEKRQ